MKKWFRNILKGTSLSTALFIFQACYGMPMGYEDVFLDLQVVDGDTNNPIPDADVMFKESDADSWTNSFKTDENGMTYISAFDAQSLDIKFEAESYQSKDTTITDLSDRSITVKLYKK